MVLQDYKIDGEYICISKKELEILRDHYHKVSVDYFKRDKTWQSAYYVGKETICIDILKMFEL